jgi:hypothetical protein
LPAPEEEAKDDNKSDKAREEPQQMHIVDPNNIDENAVAGLSPTYCDNDVTMIPYYNPMFQNDHTLVFESRFESGNLRRAI